MKKIRFIKLLLVLIGLSSTNLQAFLSPEDIEGAKALAKSPVKLEDFIQSPNEKKHWLTIEEFNFEYKKKPQTFWMTNSFSAVNRSGVIVICEDPIDANDKKKNLCLSYPSIFDDFRGQSILSFLQYSYVLGETPYFILNQVNAGYKSGGKGYSQASVKYFLDEFVSKKTNVRHVFSDCRARPTQHYFPKYGFRKGTLSECRFQPKLAVPYYWVKGEPGQIGEQIEFEKPKHINFREMLISKRASSLTTSSAHLQEQAGGEEPHPVPQAEDVGKVELKALSLKEKGD